MGNLINDYNRIKKSFPNYTVWMNINGFVQTFNGDAKITSSICETEIVYRNDEEYYVTGFKENKLNDFLKTMIIHKKKVAYLKNEE